MKNLVAHMQSFRARLPKQQGYLCDFICQNPLEVSMLTIAELAEKVGVGTATVTRMVNSLGYSSYQQFKTDLRDQTMDQVGHSYGTYWDARHSQSRHSGIEEDVARLSELLQRMKQPPFIEQVQNGAKRIVSARKVYIIGLRSGAFAADFLEQNLLDLEIDAQSLSRRSEYVFDQLLDMTEDDLLVAFASRPYVRKTADVVELCSKRHIPVLLLLWASGYDRLEEYAEQLIRMPFELTPFDTTPIFLEVELLAKEVGRISGGERHGRYRELEQMLRENGLAAIWA